MALNLKLKTLIPKLLLRGTGGKILCHKREFWSIHTVWYALGYLLRNKHRTSLPGLVSKEPRMTSGTTLKGKERNGTRVSRNLLLVFCGVHKAHTCPPPDPGSDTFHFPNCCLKTSHILLVWCLYLEWSFGLVCFSYSYSTFKTHLCEHFSISFPSFHSYFKPLLMESFSCQIIGLL